MSLPIYRICKSMKYCFNADYHACDCFVAPVNGFNSANLNDIIIHIAATFYSCYWDIPGAPYSYLASCCSTLHNSSVLYPQSPRSYFSMKKMISKVNQQNNR